MSKPQTAEVTAPAIDPAELESAILKLSRGMELLNSSRLRRETIILLVSDASGIGKRDVTRVLAALTTLENRTLKPMKVRS